MRDFTVVSAFVLAALTGIALRSSCQSPPTNSGTSSPPAVDTLTAAQIAGNYYGQITFDNYEDGSYFTVAGSATITPTAIALDNTACECAFSSYLAAPERNVTRTICTAGCPLSLQRECSSRSYQLKFVGKCDGTTLQGILDQYHVFPGGILGTHMLNDGFVATRHSGNASGPVNGAKFDEGRPVNK